VDVAYQTKQKRIVDGYLVACARLGDRAAQQKLVERYQTKFLRHAYRLLGDPEQARDSVQDGWIEILRGLPKLRDEDAFAAWAFRIITRRCAKLIAGLQKTRATLKRAAQTPPEEHGAADIELAAERGPLRAAMARLPAGHRAAVALFYLEDLSVGEVAVALDLPAGTVKTRLMHAREKLRAALQGEER